MGVTLLFKKAIFSGFSPVALLYSRNMQRI
jgi:hypothetical protein